MPNVIIQANEISRTFKSVKKEAGLSGSLKLLFNPQHTTHEALKKVSFSIEEGAFVGLIGANGAGKTTLLKILSGLIPTTSGSARVMSEDPFRRSMAFRKRIALVMGQKAQLWWDLPATDAFDLLRAIYEIPVRDYQERLNALAELLDVTRLLQTQIRRLSLGERMKMELIGALLHWPKVIFLDEPTIGLDLLAALKLREFLKEFNQREKATILLTSHNMEDIERLCSRVLILKEGLLIYDGTPEGLTKKGERQLKIRLLEAPSVEEVIQQTGLKPEEVKSSTQEDQDESEEDATAEKLAGAFTLQLHQTQISQVLQKILQRYTIVDMGIHEQSLETVIQNLFAEKST